MGLVRVGARTAASVDVARVAAYFEATPDMLAELGASIADVDAKHSAPPRNPPAILVRRTA